MAYSKVSRAKRIAAGIMGLMLLVIVLFSAFYIAAEIDHDCSGEDCSICACIQQCENTLRGVGNGTASQSAFVVHLILMLLAAAFAVTAVSKETLVSRKVRLNN